ncbi:MAG: agmatinase [Acidisphaera sp.]|nr:agmatinase [Acidisphaera sp.]
MSLPLLVAPAATEHSFLRAPVVTDLDALDAHIAVFGMPFGDPYGMEGVANDQSKAPAAVRLASDRACRGLDRYDFDLSGTLFDGRPIRLADCGDVPADPRDLGGHYAAAERAVRRMLEAGALPIMIGGDHGVPIPVLRAYDGRGPITLVQVDAHIDWRDEVDGVRTGYSSPIRRASEMAHVGDIVQIGIRGQGSARAGEVADALAYGAKLITAYEVHDRGMEAVLERIPDGGSYYLTIDADGLDPSVMPAVAGPVPGGLDYHQVRKLIHGLVAKGRVVGMDVVEIAPTLDVNRITAITAGRLIMNLIGAAVRAGYFEK